MAFFVYEGGPGDAAPNGVFHFRGVNFEVGGEAKELTDPEHVAKARAMAGTLREVDAPGVIGDGLAGDAEEAASKGKGRGRGK